MLMLSCSLCGAIGLFRHKKHLYCNCFDALPEVYLVEGAIAGFGVFAAVVATAAVVVVVGVQVSSGQLVFGACLGCCRWSWSCRCY